MPPLEPPKPPAPKPRRRWWSLSVRGLMLLVLLVGGLIGWEVNRVARIKRAVGVLVRNPGDPPGDRPETSAEELLFGGEPGRNQIAFATVKSAWTPDWLRALVGDEHLPRRAVVKLVRAPSMADWKAIADLGPIFSLAFEEVPLEGEDFAGLPAGSDLDTLDLFHTKITDKAMPRVGTFRNLRKLNLGLTRVTAAGLAPLANLTHLTELDLSFGAGTDAGLGHLRGLTNLRVLQASGSNNEVSDVGLGYLRGMTQLEELEFDARHVTDAGMTILTGFARLKSLKIKPAFPSVSEAFQLSPAGVALLGQFPRLETLHLSALTATDDSWLRAIGGLTTFRDLRVGGDAITDAGLAPLANLTRLEELRISSPKVTDAGLVHLRPLTGLTRLGFYAQVSDKGLAGLQATLPALKQVHNDQWPSQQDGDTDGPLLAPLPLAPPPLPPSRRRF